MTYTPATQFYLWATHTYGKEGVDAALKELKAVPTAYLKNAARAYYEDSLVTTGNVREKHILGHGLIEFEIERRMGEVS